MVIQKTPSYPLPKPTPNRGAVTITNHKPHNTPHPHHRSTSTPTPTLLRRHATRQSAAQGTGRGQSPAAGPDGRTSHPEKSLCAVPFDPAREMRSGRGEAWRFR